MFLIFLYFVGSCTECSEEYTPAVENSTPVYTELTPDEYQKQMDEIINKPPVTHTAFKSPVLQAHAFSDNILNDFFEKTNAYDVIDWTKGYFDYLRNPDYYPEDDANIPPPTDKSNFDNPVTSTVIPYHYNAYGKLRINYNNGVFEIVACRFDADLSTSTQTGKGHVTITRNNSDGYSTSFGFDIKLIKVNQNFSGNSGFAFDYLPLNSNVSGIDTTAVTWKDIVASTSQKHISFSSETTNSIRTSNANTPPSYSSFITVLSGGTYNTYTVSQTLSNHYEFNTALKNYQNVNSRTKSVNVYYNNNAMSTVTTNNYNQYSDYGYTYNNITGSLEINPDILANYFNNAIKPALELGFDDLFSSFPDIDATLKDYTGELNNLVEIIEQQYTTQTTTIVNYLPVVTGDVNVNVSVDVTFPPNFYKTYPPLTTQPAFIAKNPDIDYAFDEPLPLEILNSSAKILNMATEILTDNGLMPVYIMCVALSLVALFLL